ncbi:hypothetical protein DLAC_04979 [Tieghemostelium lacteum]|uniref:Uncharacterized protein n=1 Tax=Tieghemostelium lacteum TaxID=361077 RepID=A0A151ZI67_TIELA|nr:hypothetical protein DLAC_04979 [Tieghemostelium lacteum]|eukprot:KYQ93605.1 hypothetical protein DLAC_04979 [Tieghemostelium lacteum]
MAEIFAIEEAGAYLISGIIASAKSKAIAAGVGTASGLFLGYISNELNLWVNKEDELKNETLLKFDESFVDTHEKDSMMIILVTEKNMWDKTIRIEKNDGTSFDLYTGDSVKSHPLCNIAVARVNMDQPWTYSYRKPKFFGIWCQMGQKFKIHDITLKEWNKKTMVIFWDNDGSGYFKNNEGNQIKADELFKFWHAAQFPTL